MDEQTRKSPADTTNIDEAREIELQGDDNTQSLALSFSPGGYSNTHLENWQGSFDELCALLKTPSIGPKDGSYFVRGSCLNGQRADANITRASVVIIDGDKQLDPDTGAALILRYTDDPKPKPIFAGSIGPELVHEALQELGIPHCLYTSHSHDPDTQMFRWRAVIPADIPDPETLAAVVEWVIAQLHGHRCWVYDSTENYRWSQPWYLPRVRDEAATFQYFELTDADPLPLADILAWHHERIAERVEKAPKPPPSERKSKPKGNTPISRFNAAYGNLESMADLLEKYGYAFTFCDSMENIDSDGVITKKRAYRFLYPLSQSGRPGVHLYQGEQDGEWLVYSHHGDDPLKGKGAKPRTLDAFGVWQCLEHGDDWSKAFRGVTQLFPPEKPKSSDPEEYRLLKSSDLAELPPQQWRVKGLIPASGMFSVYGPSGSGKSFLVLDLAAAIVRGVPDWFGHRVKPSPVVYCALEGEAGIKQRVQAYEQQNGPLPDDIRFILQKFDLTDADNRTRLVQAIHGEGLDNPVVILDTLSRATPGIDENSSMDMGLVVSGADEIKRELQGLVLLVHHTGKNLAAGARGHSSFKADLDGLIEVNEDMGVRSWRAEKVKDGMNGGVHGFTLEIIELGTDEDDDPITSCVIQPVDTEADHPSKAKRKPMPESVRYGLESLLQAIDEHDERDSIGLDEWREVFYRGHAADNKRVPFNRARQALLSGKVVEVEDDVYTLTDCFDAEWSDAFQKVNAWFTRGKNGFLSVVKC